MFQVPAGSSYTESPVINSQEELEDDDDDDDELFNETTADERMTLIEEEYIDVNVNILQSAYIPFPTTYYPENRVLRNTCSAVLHLSPSAMLSSFILLSQLGIILLSQHFLLIPMENSWTKTTISF